MSQKASQAQPKKDSSEETMAALQTIAGSMTGEELTEEDLHRLGQDIKNDEDAKSAVQGMTDLIKGEKSSIKYCPEDGKRYSAHLKYCPGTTILLKVLEE